MSSASVEVYVDAQRQIDALVYEIDGMIRGGWVMKQAVQVRVLCRMSCEPLLQEAQVRDERHRYVAPSMPFPIPRETESGL